jgi:hypothetical protein
VLRFTVHGSPARPPPGLPAQSRRVPPRCCEPRSGRRARCGRRTGRRSALGSRATPQSLAATADNLAALSGLTADNPRRQATFAQLQAPVHDKLAELAETITRRRTQGFAAAQSVVLTDRGAGSMATIRELLDHMRSEENRLLTKHARASAAGAAYTQQGILWGSLLVGGAALVVARAITGPVRQVTAAARRIVAGT